MDRSHFSDYDTVALWWMALSAQSTLPKGKNLEDLFEKTTDPFDEEMYEDETLVGTETGTKES
ncbi:hypothetical protein E3J62_09685 [candidate division TA06 bacterium]|uniref:Uncharacterized protein n=1 Tax=candidate division TA06 bacterium TaxID=2250710 RepID=A0A523UQ44_UNCT6|nr:MAG: hypothetical protein E3J62_09685 [candidate division TA06 bacterium]